jgi:hypothetical protein
MIGLPLLVIPGEAIQHLICIPGFLALSIGKSNGELQNRHRIKEKCLKLVANPAGHLLSSRAFAGRD